MKILVKSVRFIYNLLSEKYKSKAIGISLLLLLNSVLELIGLGAIFPVFLVLLEDNVVENNTWAKWIVDNLGLVDERQLIVVLAVGLFVVFLLKNLLSLWIVKTQTTFSASLFKDLMLRMHKLYYHRGFIFFKNTNSNVMMRDIKGATEKFSQTCMQSTISLINEVIILFVVITAIAVYNFQVFIILLITVIPITLVFYKWVRKRSLELGETSLRIDPIIWKNIFESIYGYVDVIISGTEKVFRDRINKKAQIVVDVNIKSNIYNSAPSKVIETSLMFAIGIILSFGIYYLPSKTDLLKLLGLFVVAGYRIIPSVSRMMISINGLNQSYWVFDILSPLLKEEKLLEVQQRDLAFKHSLKLENVSFSYSENSKVILNKISLEIKKGETIGIIGSSGAGKTTLMNILLGFLKPNKGNYIIDNQILDESFSKAFYEKVGYVQQQVYLIDGTIADNIAFGINKEFIDIKKINDVIMHASLTSMIDELPDGIHTYIGENGTMLSGGQRQRVGIARALYFNAEILFFDEATSALDSETEKEITEAIQKLSNGELTIIIIAHRATSLKNTDRILRIEKGQEITEIYYDDIKDN